jgi:catalase
MARTPNMSADLRNTGNGGEPHQIASTSQTRQTTRNGVPFSDHPNALKRGPRGPSLLEGLVRREKTYLCGHGGIPRRHMPMGSRAQGQTPCSVGLS